MHGSPRWSRPLMAGAATILCLGAPAGAVLRAQAPTAAPISAADLRARLSLVAHDSMGGRASGTDGHLKATAYLAAEAERLGLQPAGNRGTFFQDLPLVSRGFVAGGSVTAGDERFVLGEDFGATAAREAVVTLPASARVIVGGELGDSASYPARAAIEGRVVLLKPNSRAVSFGLRALQIGEGSQFSGAAAVVIAAWDQLSPSSRRQLGATAMSMRGNTTQLPPTLVVSARMMDALLRRTGGSVGLDLQFVEAPAAARNVIAVLPGSDPALKAQYVALGAHSDHQGPLSNRGRGDSVPALPDTIRNGADDDGSGVVALLEIAEALANVPKEARPARSILFVWHAAEELGLYGSDWFTEHPTVERDSIVAHLNLDMVGRGGAADIKGGGPEYLQLIGARRLSPQLGDLVEKVNARSAMPFRFDYAFDAEGHKENLYCRSDHAKYARFGIPVAFFSTGLHPDYHRVTDEAERIDYDKLERVTLLVRDVAVAIGNRKERFKLAKPKPDPSARCRQ